MKTFKILSLFISLTCLQVFAGDGVAKVIIVKGKAITVNKESGKKYKIKKGMWIKEGITIKTSNRSFVKLVFIDKSQISVGPKSSMEITSFKKREAGILSILKGKVRSQVTKNYMEMSDKEKSKLFLKTRNAAMGVRGTDFEVIYDEKSNNTSLITYSGAVAMGKIEDFNIKRPELLERIVSHKNAVLVQKGQFSKLSREDARPIPPKELAKEQFEHMKNNRRFNKDKFDFRGVRGGRPIPPGMDRLNSKIFKAEDKHLDRNFSQHMRPADIKEMAKDRWRTTATHMMPPPNMMATGEFFDPRTGTVVKAEDIIFSIGPLMEHIDCPDCKRDPAMEKPPEVECHDCFNQTPSTINQEHDIIKQERTDIRFEIKRK